MTATETVDLPFLYVNYQKELDVLFCRWRTHVNLVQFIEGYTAVLQLAAQKGAHFWLHDLRLRNNSNAEQKQWFANNFIPALQAEMGNINFIAYLMLPLQHAHLTTESQPKPESMSFRNHLTIRYYTNEHDALEWLDECRHRVII